jgi:hypothetical protein
LIWDATTCSVVRKLEGHIKAVSSISWHPAGHDLASVSYDNTVRVWRISAAAAVATLRCGRGYLLTTAWHPAGERVASGGKDGAVRAWEPFAAPRGRGLAFAMLAHPRLGAGSRWAALGAHDDLMRAVGGWVMDAMVSDESISPLACPWPARPAERLPAAASDASKE